MKNKHLEGIPGELEVMEKGIDVAEMNALLLKKVEELTVYVVELEKMVNSYQDIQNAMDLLKSEIKELKDRISTVKQ